ncbi:MAG TPA: hypothetical protein ENI92_05470, partial [Bacteroidetes bacterium]|nr:hypothetical protein [Bacteroidota bacterium]
MTLVRAGSESYTTSLLKAVRDDEGALRLVVDRLLPEPDEDFWTGSTTLHGSLVTFDAGVEVTIGFRASVGGRIELDSTPAVELVGITDVTSSAREYIANLGDAHPVELGMIWFGEWVQVTPTQASVSRLFFDAELDEEIGPDGYAVPKAALKLASDAPDVAVQLQLYRRGRPSFEAKIEKIDGIAKQTLVSLIESIWQVSSGLAQRKEKAITKEIGYRSTVHDHLAEAFQQRIVLLAREPGWERRLEEFGKVVRVGETREQSIVEAVSEGRCDLILGDA